MPEATTTPVKKGQWRKATVGVWAVYAPHPRRKGFWIAIDSIFPYEVFTVGRRELEGMPLAGKDYFHGPHPGVKYRESLTKAMNDIH